MKYYPKMHCVEAEKIKEVLKQSDSYLITVESGESIAITAATLGLSPIAGDYLVTDEDGRTVVMSESSFESKYQQVEYSLEPVSIEGIQEKVVCESFGTEGRMVVCFLTFDNGFKTSGHSFCMLDDEFDEGLGQSVAYRNATEKLWEIEGYRRMQLAYEITNACIIFDKKRDGNA